MKRVDFTDRHRMSTTQYSILTRFLNRGESCAKIEELLGSFDCALEMGDLAALLGGDREFGR